MFLKKFLAIALYFEFSADYVLKILTETLVSQLFFIANR
jgi:hypothetical protein